MQDVVRKLFDDCADHYATERETLAFFQDQLAIALSMLSNEKPGVILDIGCAAGAEIPALRANQFKVIGIDLSERMLQLCRMRCAADSEVQLCCADAEHLPLPQSSIDHVLCLGVFEFLNDYSAALTEIFRVLRPGGLAVIAIPSRISLYYVTYRAVQFSLGMVWHRVKRLLVKRPKIPPNPGVNRNRCIPWKFRNLLRNHGFDPERSAFSNFFVYPLDRFPRLDAKVAALLEPLASIPILQLGASVYLVSARKRA